MVDGKFVRLIIFIRTWSVGRFVAIVPTLLYDDYLRLFLIITYQIFLYFPDYFIYQLYVKCSACLMYRIFTVLLKLVNVLNVYGLSLYYIFFVTLLPAFFYFSQATVKNTCMHIS